MWVEAAQGAPREEVLQMDEHVSAATVRKRRGRWLGPASLVAAGLVAGGILAGSQIAGAQGATSGTQAAATRQGKPAGNPATMTHGPGETLLTGDAAAKVTAAAKKEVPGATIIRVETDSDGAAYEAHTQKADGTFVTVKFDKSFNVTGTAAGFGGPGPGGSPPN
jgi:hypothetical protein